MNWTAQTCPALANRTVPAQVGNYRTVRAWALRRNSARTSKRSGNVAIFWGGRSATLWIRSDSGECALQNLPKVADSLLRTAYKALTSGTFWVVVSKNGLQESL